MSRYVATKSVQNEEITLIYGWDHALGFFYEIWENYGQEEVESCLKDRCSFLHRMPNSEMIEVMESFSVPKSRVIKIALDTPF
jgi:hypothetical protein